jgi:hypothetical protein
MNRVADSSFFEYGKWYREREKRKGCHLDGPPPTTEDEMRSLFKKSYPGKYWDPFPRERWSICLLDYDEFKKLMIVDGAETRSEQLVIAGIPRTLKNAARNAVATGYFETMRWTREKHFWYYLSYRFGSLVLNNKDRLVVRTMNEDEKKQDVPKGTFSYYLHDGWGRALPYMVLLFEKRIKYDPVEVFLAEENCG